MIGNGEGLHACKLSKHHDVYQISWQTTAPQKVSVYLDALPGEQGPVAVVDSKQVEIAVPADRKRHYFFLQPEYGKGVWLAERSLDIEGAANTRDFGGYITSDGRQVCWGRLFRTGHLASLSTEDHRYLDELGVKLICDFRRPDELERHPSKLDGVELEVVHLPIHPGSSRSFYENLQEGRVTQAQMAEFMENINREFVVEQSHQFAQMFRLILNDKPQLLIHCAVGKDRTGFAAAMILSALGVPQETVLQDYLLSNTYLPFEQELARLANMFQKPGAASKVSLETLRPMLEVREGYLFAAFEEIKRIYGDLDNFLCEGLGLTDSDLQELRAHYLY